jgi:uncharacterized protein YkwD
MTLQKAKPKRVTPTHRKRVGQHHKHGQHYLKSYWPYLPILAILFVGVLTNNWLKNAHHDVLGYATDVSAQTLLTDTNKARQQAHESNLQLNTNLTRAAQAKAEDMVSRNYWSHITPDGKQPWSFIVKTGYDYQQAGENLAYGFGTSDQIIDAWMNSSEHRANILNNAFTQVGFAVANSQNYHGNGPETIVVAMYAEPVGAVLGASPETPQSFASSQPVSRIQLLTSSTWIEMALAALSGAAITLFFIRHSFAWHKVLVRSEHFVLHHPFFDMFLISLATLSFLLSHLAGTIL